MSMKRILVHIGFAVLVLSLIPLFESRAQTSVGKKTSIKIIYSALTASNAPVWGELVDLATQRIPFLQGAIIVNRNYLQRERPVVLNFLRAFVESMKICRENPDITVASLTKHLRISQDVARGAYRSFVNVSEEVPYVRAESVQAILDFLPREQARDITTDKYIDNSLIKELVTSGFIKTLYRK